MSTTVGNGLTVDGTVKASQATQAGEAVVLGDDGLVPASLLGATGGMNQVKYTGGSESALSALLTAVSNGEVPPYAQAIVTGYHSTVGSGYPGIILIKYLSQDYIMPSHGNIRTVKNNSNHFFITGISSDGILYMDGSTAPGSFWTTSAIAFWRD